MNDRKFWFNILIILCVSYLMTFTYLGHLPLLDPDEPVYAETALEMLQNHDFISPRIYGDFWYDKPPMYYWLVAGAFKLFGVGEFGARFPSAMLAAAGSILMYVSGRKLFNERAGLIAALILASSLEYFYLSKAAVTDITLAFFLTGALLAFFHKKNYLFYTCAALAVVTKGPIGIFFCGVIVGLYLLLTGSLGQLKHIKLLSGGLLFTAFAAPWYLMMYHIHGMDFINTFLGFHNVTRFLQPEHPEGTLWYYYIPVLVIGFFPWTTFMLQAFLSVRKAAGNERNQLLFLGIWISVVFLFFTLSQTKLVSYILPLYPPLALLVGWYFDKAWTEKRSSILKWSAAIFALVVLVLEIGLYVVRNEFAAHPLLLVVMAAILFLMAVLAGWQSYRKSFSGVLAVHVVGMILFTTFLMGQLLPVMAPSFSSKGPVQTFKQCYDGQAPVYVAKFYRPGFAFYSGLAGIEFDQQTLAQAVTEDGKAYFLIQRKYYDKLPEALKAKVRVLAAVEDKIMFVREVY